MGPLNLDHRFLHNEKEAAGLKIGFFGFAAPPEIRCVPLFFPANVPSSRRRQLPANYWRTSDYGVLRENKVPPRKGLSASPGIWLCSAKTLSRLRHPSPRLRLSQRHPSRPVCPCCNPPAKHLHVRRVDARAFRRHAAALHHEIGRTVVGTPWHYRRAARAALLQTAPGRDVQTHGSPRAIMTSHAVRLEQPPHRGEPRRRRPPQQDHAGYAGHLHNEHDRLVHKWVFR